MKRAMLVVLGLCVMSPALYADEKKGDELTDPIEILKKADAAAKAVNIARYHATYEGTGGEAQRSVKVEGNVVLTGWTGNGAEKFRCDAKVTLPGSSDVKEVTVGNDGKALYALDHATRKAYDVPNVRMFGRVSGSARQLMVFEFVHPTPFSDEINGKNQEIKGTKKIGDEDCYEIHLEYNQAGSQPVIWYFSKKDFLPRGVNRLSNASGGEDGQLWMITNLVVDPKSEKDPFEISIPESYTKTEGRAP